jgi:hypothetical protein
MAELGEVALNCGCKTSGLGCKTSSLNVTPPYREHDRFSVFRRTAISISHALRKTFTKSELWDTTTCGRSLVIIGYEITACDR